MAAQAVGGENFTGVVETSRIASPALEAAGIDKRGPYCLRHTFATEALAAGISTFELSRLMGTSLAMIDRHYGHLARDSEAAIRARLESGAFSRLSGVGPRDRMSAEQQKTAD